MNKLYNALKLEHRYLHRCPRSTRLFLALGILEVFVFHIYSSIVSPAIVTVIYNAIETGSASEIYKCCGYCIAIVLFFCGMCFINDVYVDFNSFKIIESVLKNGFSDLYDIPQNRLKGNRSDEEIQTILDDGAGNVDAPVTYIALILSCLVSMALLLRMAGSVSVLLLALAILDALIGFASANKAARMVKHYVPIQQKAESSGTEKLSSAVNDIITAKMNQREDELYNQYRKARQYEWHVQWKKTATTQNLAYASDFAGGGLRTALGFGIHREYAAGNLKSAAVASSFSIYDQVRSLVQRFRTPITGMKESQALLYAMDQMLSQKTELTTEGEMPPEPVIRVNNISFRYTDEQVLEQVSLEVKSGEKVAIIGRNGSGKSTLMKIIAGIYQVEHGNAEINSIECSAMVPQVRHELFCYIPANVQLYSTTVRDNVEMNAEKKDEERFTNAMLSAGFNDDEFPENQWAFNLSGGQMRRVGIARGMIHQAPILLADEPMSDLPQAKGKAVLEALLQSYPTCLITTHQKESIGMFDRVIILDKGRIAGDYFVSEFLNTELYCNW